MCRLHMEAGAVCLHGKSSSMRGLTVDFVASKNLSSITMMYRNIYCSTIIAIDTASDDPNENLLYKPINSSSCSMENIDTS